MSNPPFSASTAYDGGPGRPAKFAGLALASLILGIIALVFSIIPIVNIVGIIVGVIGLVLGLIGLAGSRPAMSASGVVLSILAIIAAVVINKAFVDRVNHDLGQGPGTVNGGSAVVTTAAPDATPPTPPMFGQTYTWASGLAIEVGVPKECKPSQSAHPQTVQRGVVFAIVIKNGSSKAFETALLTMGMQAQYGGRTAERIIDLTGGCNVNNFEAATVLPGKQFDYTVALAAGKDAAEMQLTFQPGLLDDKAVFIGNA